MLQLSITDTEFFLNGTINNTSENQTGAILTTSGIVLLSTEASDEEAANLTSNTGYLFLVLELCLMIIILFGNGLTIIAIATTPSLQTLTYRSV